MNLSVLDIIILTAIAASAVWGIFKGFVRQIVSILALLLGIWCAARFTASLSSVVKEWLSLEIAQQTLHIILFVAIFIVVMILAHFIGKGIESIIKLSMLGWLNRLMGFLFGAFKAIIILSVAVYAVEYINGILDLIPSSYLNGSEGYGFLKHFAHNFFPYLKNCFS